jgi:sn-glycerol 3-phosphate transport system substrate-binding protein
MGVTTEPQQATNTSGLPMAVADRVLTRRTALRRAIASVAATGAAGWLASCGPIGNASSAIAKPTAPPVKLTYLHQWSPQQGHGPITDKLAARFRQQHPSIDIQPVYAANYYEKLTTVLAGGDWPDVVTYNLAYLPELVSTKAVVAAEDLAKGQYRYDKNDLVAGAKEQATFNGKLTAMPYCLNNSGLAYNLTLYKRVGLDPAKPPTTWDELVAQSQRLTNRGSTPPIWGTVFPKGTADPISPLLAFIWQNGGEVMNADLTAPRWTEAPAVEALQFQVDLVHKYNVANLPSPSNGDKGDVGIWHIPPGNVSVLDQSVKNAFEWGTAALPKQKQQATTVGGHSLAVLHTNKYEQQAWQFVQWWTQPAQNAEYLVASATLPPWHASEQQQAWKDGIKAEPRTQPFVDMLAYGRPTPKLIGWQQIITLLGTARDDASTLKKTPQQALNDAALQAAPLIKQG